MKNIFYLVLFFCLMIAPGAQLAFAVEPAASASPSAPNPPAVVDNSVNKLINPEYSNINNSKFRLLICDGPEELRHYDPVARKIVPGYTNKDFVPCDFRGLMMQIQHLINIAMTAGVLIAIAGMMYAGFLYISGTPKNISQAHDIFPSLVKGFIIMLAAWFIVYQILAWLTGTNGYGVLLGL